MNNFSKFAFLAGISSFFLLLLPASAQTDKIMKQGIHNAQCILAASQLYKIPTSLILILLNVEGGNLGSISYNTNNTVDIGPMQINQIWLQKIASHWKSTPEKTEYFLKNNFCANVEAGTWILSKGLEESKGDIWQGVGYYHSHNPKLQEIYLKKVLQTTLNLYKKSKKSS